MEKKNKKIVESLKLNSKDVGSSEVQIGLLSEKIDNLTNHFKKNKNDKHSSRGLLKAVNQRKRLLEYLKRKNPESYTKILTKIYQAPVSDGSGMPRENLKIAKTPNNNP